MQPPEGSRYDPWRRPEDDDMPVNLWIGVTDNHWFDSLRQRTDLDEVNFWQPSARGFRTLQTGELFLFKLKAPRNVIAGGGVFFRSSIMPLSLAWEAFGEKNGTSSLEALRTRILANLHHPGHGKWDFDIGCRVLTQPFFLEEDEWIDVPRSWSPNIVAGKTYPTDTHEGRWLWDAVNDRVRWRAMAGTENRFGPPQIVTPRLGQGAFRTLITDLYERRCAVTRERTLPVLDAAHIQPYGRGGHHEARNGLLLRRDLHKLFDEGYVTVTPSHHLEVSRSIKEDFGNGRDYYALHGRSLFVPGNAADRPDRSALTWHNENCFRD